MGDFNIRTRDMREHRSIWDSKYQESTDFIDYVSFPSEGETFDHMLIKPGFKFESIKKFDGISDHSAMIFTIRDTR